MVLEHEILINCILVDNDIRPSMLIQPQDYGEATGSDINTKLILTEIKQIFPQLIHSENYKVYQGILISKKSYDDRDIDLQNMGRILGYPCYADLIILIIPKLHIIFL